MNENYSLEDEALMIEYLSKYDTDYIWNEFVETCTIQKERIYWRNLFFDCLYGFSPLHLTVMPAPFRFRMDIEEWIKTF